MTNFQIKILKWIAKKIVIQSSYHQNNIIQYYKIIAEAATNEFREDNKITMDSFLIECHERSLKVIQDKDIPCCECLCLPICKSKAVSIILRCPPVSLFLNEYQSSEHAYRVDLLIRYLSKGFI